jgi:hypothetical protein
MEDNGFKRQCLKAFLRYGASVPDPRKDNRFREAPPNFHAGHDASASIPMVPGRPDAE